MSREAKTAEEQWTRLTAKRQSMIDTKRRCASLTTPWILMPQDYDENSPKTLDYQSLGAQCANHLTNKMVMAMLAPTRPAFRLQPGDQQLAELDQLDDKGATSTAITKALGKEERRISRVIDATGQRAKVYLLMMHLIVIGDVLLFSDKKRKKLRVLGIENFAVKRCLNGDIHTVIVRERILFDELPDDVQAQLIRHYSSDDAKVSHYTVLKFDEKRVSKEEWVDRHPLGEAYQSVWKIEDCPWNVFTWSLTDHSDYGTSLVEWMLSDFEALSTLSEAVVNGAVLASEFRWLLDPTSKASADDVENSENGAIIPGRKDDLTVAQAQTAAAVNISSQVLERWEQRIARAFLLMSAVTRNAERVTAEEIRALANELETSHGGTYSHLASSVIPVIVRWMMAANDRPLKVDGKQITIEIVTGLDALSRSGDLDALRMCLQDAAMLGQLPPMLQQRLKLDNIFTTIAAGHGVDFSDFVMSEDEFKQAMNDAVQANAANAAAVAGAEAAATQGATAQ